MVFVFNLSVLRLKCRQLHLHLGVNLVNHFIYFAFVFGASSLLLSQALLQFLYFLFECADFLLLGGAGTHRCLFCCFKCHYFQDRFILKWCCFHDGFWFEIIHCLRLIDIDHFWLRGRRALQKLVLHTKRIFCFFQLYDTRLYREHLNGRLELFVFHVGHVELLLFFRLVAVNFIRGHLLVEVEEVLWLGEHVLLRLAEVRVEGSWVFPVSEVKVVAGVAEHFWLGGVWLYDLR